MIPGENVAARHSPPMIIAELIHKQDQFNKWTEYPRSDPERVSINDYWGNGGRDAIFCV